MNRTEKLMAGVLATMVALTVAGCDDDRQPSANSSPNGSMGGGTSGYSSGRRANSVSTTSRGGFGSFLHSLGS